MSLAAPVAAALGIGPTSALAARVYAIDVARVATKVSVDADVDLGFGYWAGARLRLAGGFQRWVPFGLQPGARLHVRITRNPAGVWWATPVRAATPTYVYQAVLGTGHDGDNVRADIHLGLTSVLRSQSIRLAGCNARELADPGGPEARLHLARRAPAGTVVLLHSLKDDKYGGRYVGRVIMPDGTDLAGGLVADGWAAAWDGRGERPVPPWPRPAWMAAL